MGSTDTQDKVAKQLQGDMERAYGKLAEGPLHIHAICSKLRIPKKGSRARRLYLAIQDDSRTEGGRFKRSPVPESVWERAA